MESKKCRAGAKELKNFNFWLWFFAFTIQLLFIFDLFGCSSIMSPFVISKRQKVPYDAGISDSYYKVELKKSGALNVLPVIHKPETEMLSQSRSVVASFGQEEDGYKSWFNMVAFDEVSLTARRKYFFLVDEKVKRLPGKRRWFPMEPKRGIMFDGQMVLDESAFDRRGMSEGAGQAVQLRWVLESLHKDIGELSPGEDASGSGNQMLVVSGMLINQTFVAILRTLDKSPGLAAKLGDKDGVKFYHISFGEGTVRMVVEDDIVTVKIRVGVFVDAFEGQRKSSGKKNTEENH